jgi:flagellar hook-associated protein 3 FlgL
MRVSEQGRLYAHQGYITAVQEKMDRIQQQLATGRRIERASDDPAGASLALQHRKNLAFETQMRRNIEGGVAFMNVTEAALGGVTESLQRLRELTVQASNDALGPAERASIAREVEQLITHIAQMANTRFGDAYVFSGHQTQTPAYQVVGNPPTAVSFQGDAGERVRRISYQDQAPINLSGSQVFGTLFDDLVTLRDNLDGGAPGSVITTSLAALDSAMDRVMAGRGEIGARINRFEASRLTSEQSDINLQSLKRDIEEVDLSAAIIQLTGQQTALEAALGAIGRSTNLTLLNFLR